MKRAALLCLLVLLCCACSKTAPPSLTTEDCQLTTVNERKDPCSCRTQPLPQGCSQQDLDSWCKAEWACESQFPPQTGCGSICECIECPPEEERYKGSI